MRSKRRIIGVVAAAIMALTGTVALVGYVQSAKDEALAAERLVDVYVVGTAIPQGAAAETITASVAIEQIPARLTQPGAVTDLDDVGDLVAGAELLPGDQLVAARLVSKPEVSKEVTDKVQISALLTPERAVGGTLRKGDLVGVYLSFDTFDVGVAGPGAAGSEVEAATAVASSTAVGDDAKSANVSRLEFQHVLVTNVQTTSAPAITTVGEDVEADDARVTQVSGDQYIVTLALTAEQSERFVFATEFGRVWLANEPATVSDDGTRLVTLGNVFEVAQR